VEREGYYWDYEQAAWVRYPMPPRVEIPAQATGLEDEREADVRSG